ncbi:MAG: c-type cytochrome [Opitutaceae bacterium]
MKPGTRTVLITLAAVALALASCRPSPNSGYGLSLPEGDIDRGKAAFINLKCTECHTVKDVALPGPEKPSAIMMELGGVVFSVKTYGELVTSIINPEHIISPKYTRLIDAENNAGSGLSMPDYNQRMTVAQLIDLVAFLHSRYQLKPDTDYSTYQMYP